MTKRRANHYFKTGIVFLKEHPQVWFTAFVGLFILGSFIFTAYRFASIAQDAQEQLVNVRVGSIFDALVLFMPDVLEQPNVLRERLASIKAQNETIDYLMVIAPHGNGDWRIYVRDNAEREGTVLSTPDELSATLYRSAQLDPRRAYTIETTRNGKRYFMTARAVTNAAGSMIALVVSGQYLSEADRLIATSITNSLYMLGAIALIITVLFVRHARILDYASLYKKQLEVDEMKDSFISMASHELKSPLSVIRGYIEFLKEGEADEDKRQEYLRRIDVSATELRQLVDDILDVSRIEMGRLRFSPGYIRPADILVEVYEMFQDAAHTKGLTLALDIQEEVRSVSIRVDRGRLKQVLVNLASNAVKYTLTGMITLAARQTGDVVELSVHDTGVGMTAEEQAKLFGKFYRIEASETKGVSGTGLGLWITKYITEHMGGSISVESIKGEGSRFVVRFSVRSQTDTNEASRPE